MTFESNLVELRLILMQMTNKSYEMHHVDWPIIHSKLKALPGISKFVHGNKVFAENIFNNKTDYSPILFSTFFVWEMLVGGLVRIDLRSTYVN